MPLNHIRREARKRLLPFAEENLQRIFFLVLNLLFGFGFKLIIIVKRASMPPSTELIVRKLRRENHAMPNEVTEFSARCFNHHLTG